MKFRVELTPPKIEPALNPSDRVCVLGSCFAEHIGERLARGEISTVVNPLGVHYNPLSIARTLDYLSGARQFDDDEVFEHLGLARHWDIHTRLCGATRAETLQSVHTALNAASAQLRTSQWLYITLGTAHVWQRGDRVVSCCHKRPQAEFTRRLLTVSESVEALRRSVEAVRALNPALRVLVTVSPVRYLRDGLIESQRSKATLLLAAHELVDRIEARYFPAYELVIDDLRDYRFFERDLAHPSEFAVEYVWRALLNSACSSETRAHLVAGERATKRSRHRPLLSKDSARSHT